MYIGFMGKQPRERVTKGKRVTADIYASGCLTVFSTVYPSTRWNNSRPRRKTSESEIYVSSHEDQS